MLPFTPSAPLTLGVELELQLIEPESGDLAPSAQPLLARLPNQERIKPELFLMREFETDQLVVE